MTPLALDGIWYAVVEDGEGSKKAGKSSETRGSCDSVRERIDDRLITYHISAIRLYDYFLFQCA